MTLPTVVSMPARYPGTAVDGTRVKRGAPIAWCRATKRVLSADPKRIAALVAGAEAAAAPDRFDMMYEDACAARCGF